MQIRTTQAGTPLGFPLPMPHKPNLQDTARAAMERHQWEDALRAWLDWWADRPEEASMDADALHDRAVCHFHCGDRDEAMQLLDSAVRIQPDYSYRYASRGWLKQATGDIHGAIEDCKKALDLDPEDAITWNNLGLLEERLGYMEQAKAHFKVSDELMGIFKEHGIETEPQKPPTPTPSPDPTAGSILRGALFTSEGRQELWQFIRNGFTFKG